MRAMKKTEALSYFGDPATDQPACVTAMAAALGISRTAIYMWPNDEEGDIPELRALQIEKIDSARRAPPPADQAAAAP
jgi:hypothetical protein